MQRPARREGDARLDDRDLVVDVDLFDLRASASKAITIPSPRGMQAPASPVPLPRAVSGVPVWLASSTIRLVCSASAGNTTARGLTGSRPSASSWE